MDEIEKIYEDMENYLIANIKKNLLSGKSFHLNEEKAYGFEWEAWQSAKLRELKRYRRQNKNIVTKRLANISGLIAAVLRREAQQGKLDAYKNYKEALTHGYKSSVAVKDSFFKLNDKKVNALIKSVNNDFKTANSAVLRRANDTYRQVIQEASMYVSTGVMTEKQAIRKAIADFEARGINCIEYSNGARHTISNYSKMAIRTASTRAYLAGEGEFRKKIHNPFIIMSKHGTACKLCQPYEGKILIDDVYSGGSSKDGRYTLLSEAMKQGLYHPNCKHSHGTYYKELGKNTSLKIVDKIEENPINEYEGVHVTSSENVLNIAKKGFLKSKMNNSVFGKGIYASKEPDVIKYYKKSRNNSMGINLTYDTTDYARLNLVGLQKTEKNMFNNLINQMDTKIKKQYEDIVSVKRESPYKYRKAFSNVLQDNGYKGIIITQDLSMLDDTFNSKSIDKINDTFIDPIVGGSQIVAWDKETVKIKKMTHK